MYSLPVDIMQGFMYYIKLNLMSNQKKKALEKG